MLFKWRITQFDLFSYSAVFLENLIFLLSKVSLTAENDQIFLYFKAVL